ncbi:MAG: phosphoribosylanthranilate isomerase [candidate division Zixibacteria bacterium]|nr:phosphoribosylanthranilate isomerase [candidate division Zixibacteria bacterium]
MRTRVKICCIRSIEEARTAIEFGASALGLVSEMPTGPGVISDELIAEIAEQIPPSIESFLLTSKTDSREIIKQLKEFKTNTVQIVDELETGSYEDIRNALSEIKIVQVIHVTGEESVGEAEDVSNFVDAILLDSGNTKLEKKELGGTGRTHDWSISKQIVDGVNIPVFLAGGLDPSNVGEAIKTVHPYAVDICSGVRISGKLDKNKLKAFFNAVASADNIQ